MPDLKVTDADFDNAITGLERTKHGFENMKSVGDELAGAVGHPDLAAACRELVSSWSVNRDRIQRAIGKHLELLKQTKQAFDETEKKLTPQEKECPQEKLRPAPGAGPEPSPAERQEGKGAPSLGTGGPGGGAGVPSVTGGGGGGGLASTDTGPHKDANQVAGGGVRAELGQDLPAGAPQVGEVRGDGKHGADLEDSATGPHRDANRVDDTPANAELVKRLKEKGLPVFAVDGKVQRPLGQVEGIGTLLGSQEDPPTVSAVVDGNGKVVDIADLKPEYDEKGNLTGINQVPVSVPDLAAAEEQPGAGEGKVPGVVEGTVSAGPVLSSRTQEAVEKVKELFGGLVDVALTGGKGGGEPTLTVAGVSGIGLTALATLAALSRPAADDGAQGPGAAREDLRAQLNGLSAGPAEAAEARQATDRQALIDALLRDLPPEPPEAEAGAGASAEELRAVLAEPTGAPAETGAGTPSAEGSPESLRASLSAQQPEGGGDLGGELPPLNDLGLGVAAAGGGDGGSSTSTGSLGGPLPGDVSLGGADAASVAGGVGGSGQVAEGAHQDEVAEERRNAHLMGGMGMAAGMSAAGGRNGLTGAEEARRNEEARRLRDRLSGSKENS